MALQETVGLTISNFKAILMEFLPVEHFTIHLHSDCRACSFPHARAALAALYFLKSDLFMILLNLSNRKNYDTITIIKY